MKFFSLLLCFAFFLTINLNYNYSKDVNSVILQPDEKIGRTCEVYSNTLIIRFKSKIDSYEKAMASISGTNIQLIRPILDKSQSIKNDNSKILSAKPENIEKIIKAEEPLLRTYIIHYESDLAPELYAKQLLKTNKNIEIAEPYCIDEIQSMPNDPLVNEQQMLFTIKAFQAWDTGLSGDSSVVIGISDNGVDQEHEDLTNSVATNWGEIPNNNKDDDKNGYVDDYRGYNFAYKIDNEKPDYTHSNDPHGTWVAGICGATVNNNKGIAGVANKCRIFPIKVSTNSDPTHLPFGYQSILYAAARKLKVLNCSWGTVKVFSDIDQSIIDFAVANDVAIVAAGGNGYGAIQAWYPAGYNGVLGVGEVDQEDYASSATSLGAHVRIMAPGEGNYYTTLNNSYLNSESGTSLASPVIAGAVGLVRAKYPELSAVQSLEFVRQCTDDITQINGSVREIIPGRIDLMKAAEIDPYSIPSIKPLTVEYSLSDGSWIDRGKPGDTLKMKINAKNYLGDAVNLRFILSSVKDPLKTINVIDSVVDINEWKGSATNSIQFFKFVINQPYTNLIFLRVDIYADNGYHDFFLLPFTPSTEVTTFANKSIRYSVGDRGTFGFGGENRSNIQGIGFVYKNYGNLLFTDEDFPNAGLMAVENDSNVVSAIFNYVLGGYNDFTNVKPFIYPERFKGIINDSQSGQLHHIGLEIEQNCHFTSDTLPATKIILNVKNISGKVLKDVAVGYFLDWDVGPKAGEDKVRLFPEAIPETFNAISAAAELARYDGDFPVVAAACYSPENTFIAQAAGLSNINAGTFTRDYQIRTLTSGTDIQFNGIDDVSMVIGMKFPGEMQPGETKTCYVCIGTDDNEEKLAQTLKNCILGIVDVNEQESGDFEISIYPQPAMDFVNIKINSNESKIDIHLFDCLGKEVKRIVSVNNETNKIILPVNLSSLESGMYYITSHIGSKIISKPLMILK